MRQRNTAPAEESAARSAGGGPASRQHATRWLVRFGYDGAGFAGWARQPGRRTVEGVVRDGLRRYRLVRSPEQLRLEVASRTDRGVSARANALTLTVALDGPPLLRALNGIAPELYFTAATRVAETFRVRRAVRRTYRYFEPWSGDDVGRWVSAGRLFCGRVDVRSFGRAIPASEPCWRDVESVEVTSRPGGLTVEVRAPSFVWGMVRKIVGALREVDRGRLTLSRLETAIAGKQRLSLPMAEPEGLVLWEVEYPQDWEVSWRGPNRHQASFEATARDVLWRRRQVLDALRGGAERGVAGGSGGSRRSGVESD